MDIFELQYVLRIHHALELSAYPPWKKCRLRAQQPPASFSETPRLFPVKELAWEGGLMWVRSAGPSDKMLVIYELGGIRAPLHTLPRHMTAFGYNS